MNEITHEDMRFACDLVLFLCAFLGLLVGGACIAFFIEFGQPATDQVVSVARVVLHFIGGLQ